jgi:hypothetical protein
MTVGNVDLELEKELGGGELAKRLEEEKEVEVLALGQVQIREYKKECVKSHLLKNKRTNTQKKYRTLQYHGRNESREFQEGGIKQYQELQQHGGE